MSAQPASSRVRRKRVGGSRVGEDLTDSNASHESEPRSHPSSEATKPQAHDERDPTRQSPQGGGGGKAPDSSEDSKAQAKKQLDLLDGNDGVMEFWTYLSPEIAADITDVTTEEVMASSYMDAFLENQGRATNRLVSTPDDDFNLKGLVMKRALYYPQEIEAIEGLLGMHDLVKGMRQAFNLALCENHGTIELEGAESDSAMLVVESIYMAFANRLKVMFGFIQTRNTIYSTLIVCLLAGRLFMWSEWKRVVLAYAIMGLAIINHWFLDRYLWSPMLHGVNNPITLRSLDPYAPLEGLHCFQLKDSPPAAEEHQVHEPPKFVHLLLVFSRVFHDEDPFRQVQRMEVICAPFMIYTLNRLAYPDEAPISIITLMCLLLALGVMEYERYLVGLHESSADSRSFERAVNRVSRFFALRRDADRIDPRNDASAQATQASQAAQLREAADSLFRNLHLCFDKAFFRRQSISIVCIVVRTIIVKAMRIFVTWKAWCVDWSTFFLVSILMWPSVMNLALAFCVGVLSIATFLIAQLRSRFISSMPTLISITLSCGVLYAYTAFKPNDTSGYLGWLRLFFYMALFMLVMPQQLLEVATPLVLGSGMEMSLMPTKRLIRLLTLPLLASSFIPQTIAGAILVTFYMTQELVANRVHNKVLERATRAVLFFLQLFTFMVTPPEFVKAVLR